MPSKIPLLRPQDVTTFIEEQSFSARGDRGPVGTPLGAHAGLEVEWLTVSKHNSEIHIPLRDTRGAVAAAGTLPGGCRVTFEPGGQLELSSPADQPSGACQAVAEDVEHLRHHLSDYGIALVGMGRDPLRPERRVLESPRYVAMERYFESFGGPASQAAADGRSMMCGTASVQVNIDLGDGGDPVQAEERWRLAHLVGPTLAAAFANSPFESGAPSGWRSSRLAAWRGIDRTRTAPVGLDLPGPQAWARYSLAARVMLIRRAEDDYIPVLEPMSFAQWMANGHPAGYPDLNDLAYHLSTLFPPVRPRGWLELRMIDSLAEPWWRVPVMVATALVTDPEAAERARRACAPAADLWLEAARHGLAHPVLAAAAAECFDAALEALPRIGAAAGASVWATEAFNDRFSSRRRCPADDLLDEWASTGALFPIDHPLEPAWT